MSELIVGVFAAEHKPADKGKAVIHGLMPLEYAEFFCRLTSRHYPGDWVVYAQDADGQVWYSLNGRRKQQHETDDRAPLQPRRVGKLRSPDAGRGSI